MEVREEVLREMYGSVGRGMEKCEGRCGGKCQVSVGRCEEVLRQVWGSVGRGLEKCGGKEVCLDVGKCGIRREALVVNLEL